MKVINDLGKCSVVHVYHPIGGWNPCLRCWYDNEWGGMHEPWATGNSYAVTADLAYCEAVSWAQAEECLLDFRGLLIDFEGADDVSYDQVVEFWLEHTEHKSIEEYDKGVDEREKQRSAELARVCKKIEMEEGR